MSKVPLWKTDGFAYAFAFGSLGTIARIMWLPIVSIVAAGYVALEPAMASGPAGSGSMSPSRTLGAWRSR